MTDEKQNAPVASAETATQEEQNAPITSAETATEEKTTQADATKVAPYIYYYSDPDETNSLLHHLPIPSFIDLSDFIKQGKLWKIYDIPAPDNSMEDPVVDIKTNSWVENSKNAQTKVIAETTQAINAMKQTQAQLSQQNVAMMKSFTAQTQNTNELLASMQQTLTLMAKAVQNSATPETPKADAPAQPATTDKQENGGN